MKTTIVSFALALLLLAALARAAPKPQYGNFNGGFQDQSSSKEFREVKTSDIIEGQQDQNNGFYNGGGFNQNGGFQSASRDKEFKEVKTTDVIEYDSQQNRDQFQNNNAFGNNPFNQNGAIQIGGLPNFGFSGGFDG